jgi:hypothetical protein
MFGFGKKKQQAKADAAAAVPEPPAPTPAAASTANEPAGRLAQAIAERARGEQEAEGKSGFLRGLRNGLARTREVLNADIASWSAAARRSTRTCWKSWRCCSSPPTSACRPPPASSKTSPTA